MNKYINMKKINYALYSEKYCIDKDENYRRSREVHLSCK